ncbi:MAG TPA: hypothetical protein QF753_01365 [Victivallales bacterium]|nr:hypothetical protein [Victivallales bacterium]
MKNFSQLTFDFLENDITRTVQINQSDNFEYDDISAKDIRRAVIGWLMEQEPSGTGLMVPTRISRFRADAAAFWSKPIRKNGKNILYPVKSVIVEVRHNREECWPDCAKKNQMLPILKSEKKRRKDIEKNIRETEPELQLNDNLFPEFESWNYSLSSNKEYHECCNKINELEHSLYNGSRFERVREALLADFLYLAVPAGAVHKHEIADGWGLLYINENLTVTIEKEADNWQCPLENKYHLVQNISKSCMKSLFFSQGINIDKKGNTRFIRPPRRRRK